MCSLLTTVLFIYYVQKVVCVFLNENHGEIVKWRFFFLGSETNHNDILYIYKCTGLIQASLLKRCISSQ